MVAAAEPQTAHNQDLGEQDSSPVSNRLTDEATRYPVTVAAAAPAET